MSGFSVVAMVRETPDVIRRFVDYYRRLGAAEIFIYFNGPAWEIPAIPGAEITVCTPEFWAERCDGLVSDALEDRQRICYRDCYARCGSDWLLVVDADEFVFGDRPLAPLLAKVPASVESIFFPTAEAVWGPGDDRDAPFGCSHFRVGWTHLRRWRLLGRLVYGDVAALMNAGVMGHAIGKHMLRTGLEVTTISGHRSKRGEAVLGAPAARVLPEFARFYLGHFDALSRPRWEAKWRYRIDKVVVAGGMAPTRQAQMQMVAAALASGRSDALFRRLYGLSELQYRVLALLGTAFRRRPLFEPAVVADAAVAEPQLAA